VNSHQQRVDAVDRRAKLTREAAAAFEAMVFSRRMDEDAVRIAITRRPGMAMTELAARACAVRYGSFQIHRGNFSAHQQHVADIRQAVVRLEREGDLVTSKAPKGKWAVYHLRKEEAES
jgi:hypothetical protein